MAKIDPKINPRSHVIWEINRKTLHPGPRNRRLWGSKRTSPPQKPAKPPTFSGGFYGGKGQCDPQKDDSQSRSEAVVLKSQIGRSQKHKVPTNADLKLVSGADL